MRPPEDCAHIDELDRQTVRLPGQRARYFKTDEQNVRAPERQRTMLARRRLWTEEEDLYLDIVSHFIGREMDRWREGRA